MERNIISLEFENKLKKIATTIRCEIIKMLTEAGSGHTGGSLSCVELLVALYWGKLKHDSKNPNWPERDRFLLSKGHACPALYAVLAECGYFPKEDLKTLRKIGSHLQGHPDRLKTPGIEFSSGSLGHGISVGIGMALAAKLDNAQFRVYVLVGDGEMQEGEMWEAFSCAGHYKLDNICVILDNNNLQIDGRVSDVMNIEPLDKRIISFGWHYIEIDGHNFQEIFSALNEAESVKGKPTFIRARTVKGKGVSFIEDNPSWHGIAPNAEQCKLALDELIRKSNIY